MSEKPELPPTMTRPVTFDDGQDEHLRIVELRPVDESEDVWVRVDRCTCNAIYCGPGSGHESYCGWEEA
jgi:hypothetical protein